MNDNLMVYVTVYGTVRITPRVNKWLESIDPDWHSIYHNKSRRSKHALHIRRMIDNLDITINTLADIAYVNNEDFTEL